MKIFQSLIQPSNGPIRITVTVEAGVTALSVPGVTERLIVQEGRPIDITIGEITPGLAQLDIDFR